MGTAPVSVAAGSKKNSISCPIPLPLLFIWMSNDNDLLRKTRNGTAMRTIIQKVLLAALLLILVGVAALFCPSIGFQEKDAPHPATVSSQH